MKTVNRQQFTKKLQDIQADVNQGNLPSLNLKKGVTSQEAKQLKKLDKNGDGVVSLKDFDVNNDGKLTKADFDKNKDGKLSQNELKDLFTFTDAFDKNKDSDSFANKGKSGQIFKNLSSRAKAYKSATAKTVSAKPSTSAAKMTPAKFKQLAKTDAKKAGKVVQDLLKAGKKEDAQKLLASLGKDDPKAAATVMGSVLEHFKSSHGDYIEKAIELIGGVAEKMGNTGRFFSALSGLAGMYNIGQFFKSVYDWISQNYNAASRGHEKQGFQDAIKQFSSQISSLMKNGRFDGVAAMRLLQQMGQAHSQKIHNKIRSQHGDNWQNKKMGHVQQTAINNDLQCIKNYQKGLAEALKKFQQFFSK